MHTERPDKIIEKRTIVRKVTMGGGTFSPGLTRSIDSINDTPGESFKIQDDTTIERFELPAETRARNATIKADVEKKLTSKLGDTMKQIIALELEKKSMVNHEQEEK